MGIGEHAATIGLLSVYAGSLLALALGLHTRVAAFVAWGLHLGLMTSGSASCYGVDQLSNTFLFYVFVFSFRARDDTIPVGGLRVMQAHLCVVYLAAGLDKARGRQWWNGEAIWQTLSQPAFRTFDLDWLATHSWIPMLVGCATLIVEIGYVFFIWPRHTRKSWCLATIGLHLGTAVFMGLFFFASVMILLTSCLFLVPEKVVERARQRRLAFAAPLAAVCLPWSPDLESIVHRLMARDHVPGVAVGIVDQGHLVYGRGFGQRDVEARLPVTLETLFPLGSASKAFTATALALLADEGAITLDAPVRTYLPDFALADPVASATLTTRDILTHRSGLPRHDLFWYEAPFSRDELYHRLRFLEPSGPPHARWRYNSAMFVVAGRVVERVSGESWESFVQARIIQPVGMRRTVLSTEAMDGDADHAAAYGVRDGSVERMTMLKHASVIAPAGGVRTSVNDLVRWLTFHTMRSPPLVGEDMWRELHRAQADMPAPAESEVRSPRYALGWIRETYRGHALVMHNGAVDGFTVHVGFLPETGRAVIVLMNRDLATAALMAIAYSAYDRLLGLEPLDWEGRLEEAPTPSTDIRHVALDFPVRTVVGRYEHPAYGALTFRSQGDELAMEFRTLRFTLVYQGDRRFLSREPIADGGPHLALRFSKRQVVVPLNFEEGDPAEVFTQIEGTEERRN